MGVAHWLAFGVVILLLFGGQGVLRNAFHCLVHGPGTLSQRIRGEPMALIGPVMILFPILMIFLHPMAQPR
jgi:hypothetical protein